MFWIIELSYYFSQRITELRSEAMFVWLLL
jgi:hypothetical protein